jgi:hypothetical protein|tara:strand:+ start:88 stop:324 length:237 start_codon:yes stop_codon:yes gene_type:complete
MDKIGLTDLQPNIFRLGFLIVGKRPSMKECASQITTVNFGETFAMKNNNDDEGIALLFAIALMITLTMGLNALVQLIL